MGGDLAPDTTVRGALLCLDDPRCDFRIALYGDEARIHPLLQGREVDDRIVVVHASETIAMDDAAAQNVKAKKDSSIIKALQAHADGEAQGVISAGNTGAVMAASTLVLGRIAGVSRPTIGTLIPSLRGHTLVIDAGANVDCKPLQLQQFGIMGSLFMELVGHVESPSVGIVNVGEEEGKGNLAAAEAYDLLRQAPVNFVGNIEGRDILTGTVDVAVCDGFTGNIILKFAESFPRFLKGGMKAYAGSHPWRLLVLALFGSVFRPMFRNWDPNEVGGVPLLGVKGISIIGHGSSSPKGIKNMILKAKEMIDTDIPARIAGAFASLKTAGVGGR